MSNHLVICIFPDGDWVCNVVSDEKLESYIEYCKEFSHGRLIYVDGTRIVSGSVEESRLNYFDEMEKTIRDIKSKKA